jgi:hypothetical protein
MSELDNQRSKIELGVVYTPLADSLRRITAHYEAADPFTPAGYLRRQEELRLVETVALHRQTQRVGIQ